MTQTPATLIDALQVEQLDRYLFRGLTPKPSMPRIFGGQVLAQAMNAGARTMTALRHLHSFHAYFLRPGDPDKQIIFEVDPIRDGGSFNTRRVVAKQDGVAIYNCALSFMAPCEGYAHQEPMPATVQPEALETDEAFGIRMEAKYPGQFERRSHFPEWDIRRVNNPDPIAPETLPPLRETWFRFKPPVDGDPLISKTLLAYASDIGLMAAAFHPHAITLNNNRVQSASLDHGMWFHEPCNINDWIYYRAESHWAGHGRGLNIGKLYQRDGTLVATAVQEGLMRPSREAP